MKISLTIFLLLSALLSMAQNPVVPPGVYMADPSARVWEDGRLYLYCSVDENSSRYCSRKYHVLSTDDMLNWELHHNTFSAFGQKDEVAYNDNLLFAPDCMFKNGKYYLYYCQPDPEHAEGVAVGNGPYGPFKKGQPLDIGPYNQIDPGVFIDDDGSAYYIWGQFTLKMAKLKPNMTELVKNSIQDSVLTEGKHFFHEGAYMTKRKGLYYLIYADMSRGGMPTCIGYATSKKPMGPYTYQGVIIDNDHCDPQNWNNHGSIAEYKEQWYVFYHRATHNSRMMRKACVEPIKFNKDGTIDEVEMTSQGAGPAFNAYKIMDAASACWMFGNVRVERVDEHNEALTQVKDGDRAVIKYVDFSEGAKKVEIRVLPGKVKGTLELKLDAAWSPNIATFEIPAASDENKKWITLTSKVTGASGIHALWFQFNGDRESGDFGCVVDALIFR